MVKRGGKRQTKMLFSQKITIKSWYFIYVCYMRQKTWWWHLFSAYQTVWSILAFFREAKAGKKYQKLSILHRNKCQMSKLFTSKLFQTGNFMMVSSFNSRGILDPFQTTKMEVFIKNSKKGSSYIYDWVPNTSMNTLH